MAGMEAQAGTVCIVRTVHLARAESHRLLRLQVSVSAQIPGWPLWEIEQIVQELEVCNSPSSSPDTRMTAEQKGPEVRSVGNNYLLVLSL